MLYWTKEHLRKLSNVHRLFRGIPHHPDFRRELNSVGYTKNPKIMFMLQLRTHDLLYFSEFAGKSESFNFVF